MRALDAYLAERSGGVRLQAVVHALFHAIGNRFGLSGDVRGARPTASDTSTGQVAGIECYDPSGHLALAVEAKDRELTVTDVTGRLQAARTAGVTEILFIAQAGIRNGDAETINHAVSRSFASGENVHVFELLEFASGVLALLAESGRREFATKLGEVLESYSAPLADRRAWARVLTEL